MTLEKPELVLVLGAEGGGFEFFRRLTKDGGYRFTVKEMGCGFDRSDFDDQWIAQAAEPSTRRVPDSFENLEAAVSAFFRDGSWVGWDPLEIHPEYKNSMWKFRNETIQAAGEDARPPSDHKQYRWTTECGV